MRLRALAHRLLEAAQKKSYGLHDNAKDFYGDRAVIDYWRTIQGTHVGFVGDPDAGAGIPIAGPESFLGGAGTANPLFKSMLEKYPKGTFIGDAVRKKNFPLTAAVFIEKFVGTDDAQIKSRIKKAKKHITDYVGWMLEGQNDTLRKSTANELTTKNKKALRLIEKGKSQKDVILAMLADRESFGINPLDHHWQLLDRIQLDASSWFKKDFAFVLGSDDRAALEKSKKSLEIFDIIFEAHLFAAEGRSTIISKLMSEEGVAGTSAELDRYKIGGNIFDQIKESPLPTIGLNSDTPTEELTLRLGKVVTSIGAAYVHNQACMSLFGNTKPVRLSRGLGDSMDVAYATNVSPYGKDERQKLSKNQKFNRHTEVIVEAANASAPIRFKSRPMCGFSEMDSVLDGFNGIGISAEFPPEAFLSSYGGSRFQQDTFARERESLVIGVSSVQYSPKEFGFFPSVDLPWAQRKLISAEDASLYIEGEIDAAIEEREKTFAEFGDKLSEEDRKEITERAKAKALEDFQIFVRAYLEGKPTTLEAYNADTTPPAISDTGYGPKMNQTYHREAKARFEASVARARAKRKESKS